MTKMVSCSDVINLYIKKETNVELKVGADYKRHIRNCFPKDDAWMANSKLLARYSKLIFHNEYVQNNTAINSKIIDTLKTSSKTGTKNGNNTDGPINISKLIDENKIWNRRMFENLRVKTNEDILAYSVLLTASLAKNLYNSNLKNFNIFGDLLKEITGGLGVELSYQDVSKICPFNFFKEYVDWETIINNEKCDDLKLCPISSYDILCSFTFLLIWSVEKTQHESKVTKAVIEQFHKYVVLDIVKNNLLLNKKTKEEEDLIYNQLSKNALSKNKKATKYDDGDNELYRDNKYLRQANLYQNIDFKAINKLLASSQKKDLTVLDLGCGDGEVTCSRFGKYKNFTKILAIDKDKDQLDRAASKARDYEVDNKILFKQLDMNSDGFVKDVKALMKENNIRGIDVIFASLSLHSVSSPKELVEELSYKLLNDGGYFIIREVDDDSKLYYSPEDLDRKWMYESSDEYKKIFGFTDRNCARKVYSWMVDSGLKDVELIYDVIDTCNKSQVEKNDIFNIMVGFRKSRAEKELERGDLKEVSDKEEYKNSLNKIISANDKLSKLFQHDDFWFCAVNYIAIGQKPYNENPMFLKTINRDIEILLIRHAETSYNTENKTYTITPNGKKQIKQLSAYLKDLKIDKIYCSTMKRSIETAKPVEESHGLTIETREELNEINRGDVDTDEKWGMYEDYYHLWRQHKFDLPFPHGENGEEVWLRSKYVVDSILDDARKSKPEKDPYRVCVFTHGGTLRSMVCGILDIPQINRYQILKEFDNCSITRIKVSSNALANVNTSKPFVLESLNDTSYRNDRK